MRTILNTLRILLSIENTININAIINGIRHLPIIGKQIPETIYDIPAIKVLATIMSVIKEIMWAFFGRFCLFVFLFFVGAILSSLNDFSQNCAFLYGFLAYSILARDRVQRILPWHGCEKIYQCKVLLYQCNSNN